MSGDALRICSVCSRIAAGSTGSTPTPGGGWRARPSSGTEDDRCPIALPSAALRLPPSCPSCPMPWRGGPSRSLAWERELARELRKGMSAPHDRRGWGKGCFGVDTLLLQNDDDPLGSSASVDISLTERSFPRRRCRVRSWSLIFRSKSCSAERNSSFPRTLR